MTTREPADEPGRAVDDQAADDPATPTGVDAPGTDDHGDDHGDDHAGDHDDLDDDGQDEHDGGRRRRLSWWQESLLLLGVAVVLAVVIKALFVQAFYIPSESMEPGLVKNDRILVEKPSYWFGDGPSRGDVVVFEDPDNWLSEADDPAPEGPAKLLAAVGLYPSGGHLVKRVVGVAGDVIRCCDEQGRLVINGVPVDESSFVAPGSPCDGPMVGDCSREAWTAGPVPEGHVFVMGDNRSMSADSSYHMCLPNETDCTENPYVSNDLVVGKVFALVWPRSRMEWVSTPDVFADVPDASESAPSSAEPAPSAAAAP